MAANDRPKIKKIRTTSTILWRYFALFGCFIVMVIALVFYGIIFTSGTSRAKLRVKSCSEEIVKVITTSSMTSYAAEAYITKESYEDGFYSFVFDTEGNSLTTSERLVDFEADIWSVVENKFGTWAEGSEYDFTVSEEDQSVYYFIYCLKYSGKEAVFVSRYPVGSVAVSVANMELIMLAIAAIALVIAFGISYSLAKWLSSPLSEISVTAGKLAAGDYSVQFNSAQYAEIAALSDSLNHMKDEMKKTDDFQKELLANVTHDLKTPLTMIKAYAAMIKEISGDDKEKREKHLQVIIDEADRLTGLVNDILNASKINSGINQLNIKVFNMTEMLYGTINKFNYLQETQGYAIMVDVDPNLYTSGDEEKINQVVYNLISNAVNYTGDDKTIYISLKYVPEENTIRFAVRDTGKGISKEELAHIWDRYYRSKDSHTRPVKGTGLGLNIVKSILKSHKFNFGVNSSQGSGSTFWVVFPAVSSIPDA